MKFTASKKALLNAVRSASAATEPKSYVTVFRMVHLSARREVIARGHSDAMVIGSAVNDATVVTAGGCLVDRAVAAKVDALPDGPVTVSFDGATLTLAGGRRKLTLPGVDESDAPEPPGVGVELRPVDPSAVVAAIVATMAAVGVDDQRPQLSSLQLGGSDGEIVARATDGHRAHRYRAECDRGFPAVILPRKCADALRSACDGTEDVRVAVSGAWLHVSSSRGQSIALKLADVAMPPVDQVLDSVTGKVTAEVDAANLLDALKSIAKAVGSDTAAVVKVGKGKIAIDASGAGATAADVVDANTEGSGSAGFSLALLIDAVSAVDGNVDIVMGGALDPAKISASGFTAVVMPRRM